MENKIIELTALPAHVEQIEALLAKKGLMFIKQPSVVFPFSENHKGFIYKYKCDTMTQIRILDELNKNP